MNWRIFSLLLIAFCLASWTLTEVVEARGGGRGVGGGRGGGFSRGGGGGFSHGGGGGGSIRNSARPATRDLARPSQGGLSRPSTRDIERPSQGSLGRPSTGDVSRPSQGQLGDRQPDQLPAGGDRMSSAQQQRIQDWQAGRTPEQKQQVKDRVANMTPEQKQQVKDRMADLTPEQKDQLRQKYENSGLKPEQLPADIRDENREDWQDWRDQNREDWQDWYEDEYGDYWDDHWHSSWWYGYPVSTVSFAFYVDENPPCQKTVVINQATGTTTFYYCNSMWYQPAYTSGDVKYVVTTPPAGAEMTAIAEPLRITVNSQNYYLSNHVFYQKIIRDGQTLYVTVDAPPGARVPTIPEYAVAIEHKGQAYYRFDLIFYQRQGDSFVVVANPGVKRNAG